MAGAWGAVQSVGGLCSWLGACAASWRAVQSLGETGNGGGSGRVAQWCDEGAVCRGMACAARRAWGEFLGRSEWRDRTVRFDRIACVGEDAPAHQTMCTAGTKERWEVRGCVLLRGHRQSSGHSGLYGLVCRVLESTLKPMFQVCIPNPRVGRCTQALGFRDVHSKP